MLNVCDVLLSVITIVAFPLSALSDVGLNFAWLLSSDCDNTIPVWTLAVTLYVLPLEPLLYCSAPLKNLTSNSPASKSEALTTDSDVAENTWASFVKNTVNASEPDCTANTSILSNTPSYEPPCSRVLTS